MSPQHFNREPVSTYGQALSWLFRFSDVAEWAFDDEPALPNEAVLVCDLFWIKPDQLVKDVRKVWNQACAPALPVRSGPRRVRRF